MLFIYTLSFSLHLTKIQNVVFSMNFFAVHVQIFYFVF